MSISSSNVARSVYKNALLNALPTEVLDDLRPVLRPVDFVMSQVVYPVGATIEDVYFVEEGLVSLTSDAGDGSQVEVGMTAREGLVGISVLLDSKAISFHRAFVQVPGSAFRMRTNDFRGKAEMHRPLRDLCLRYQHVVMVQTCQAVACNARHEVRDRLARWCLMTSDRVGGDEVPMTQGFLSMMLGVRRAGVSTIASELEERGLVRQFRGHITITNRAGLEKQACVCYRVMDDCHRQIMGSTPWGNDSPLAA